MKDENYPGGTLPGGVPKFNAANRNYVEQSQNPNAFVPPPIPLDLVSDPGWRGAFFILHNVPVFARAKDDIWRHFDARNKSLNIDRMIKGRGWSTTEGYLLDAAASLFNQDTSVNLWRLVNYLNDRQMMVVIDAIRYSAFGERSGARLHTDAKGEIEW